MDSLADLKAQNIIHELNVRAIRTNFDRLIARLFERELEEWLPLVPGHRVLEVGAGCAQVTRLLKARGLEVLPIDIDPESIALGLELTGIQVVERSVYDLTPAEGPFDFALLRDVVSHLEPDRWLQAMTRLEIPRIVLIDSNLDNRLLLASRRILRHEEHHELSLEALTGHLRDHGYVPVSTRFREFLAWPLSGGLIVSQPLPRVGWLERQTVRLEERVDRTLAGSGLRKHLGWRYVAIYEREKGGGSTS